jgi:hypothetical protein
MTSGWWWSSNGKRSGGVPAISHVPQLPHPGQRSREHFDPLRQPFFDQQLLSVAEAPHRYLLGWGIRLALRQLDSARGEEVAHAVLARLAVNVVGVIGALVETCGPGAVLAVPPSKELVK